MKTSFLLLTAMLFAASCQQETCDDNELNQNETAIDCGGLCEACPTCTDGIQNQNETSTDCGGACDLCPINYPQNGFYGTNVLYSGHISFSIDSSYSMRAELPEGTSLMIKISLLTTISGPSLWFYSLGSNQNLMITTYNDTTNDQIFQSVNDNAFIELNMSFQGGGTAKVEIFENNATTATYTKEISWS